MFVLGFHSDYDYGMPRRSIDFRSFQQFRDDVVSISQGSYTRAGTWSLAEVADHLSRALEMSMDGTIAKAPVVLRLMSPAIKRVILFRRKMPAGVKAPVGLIPESTPADAPAVAKLLADIDRYTQFNQPLKPSPLFGHLTRDEWDQIHLIHASHHLSFLNKA